jgi:hypothetical protein
VIFGTHVRERELLALDLEGSLRKLDVRFLRKQQLRIGWNLALQLQRADELSAGFGATNNN